LVNIRVGSFFITIGEEETIVCPFDSKNSKKAVRISLQFIDLENLVKQRAKIRKLWNYEKIENKTMKSSNVPDGK